MPYLFGDLTKTILLKHESHKLHQEFTVENNTAIIYFSLDLVTSNTIDITVDGVAISQVTYAVSHANTMGLVATALAALASVKSATVFGATSRKIKVVAEDNENPLTVITGVVAAGAQQAVITASYNENHFDIGRPAILNADGTVAPAQPESTTQMVLGIAIGSGHEGGVTLAMKAFAIIFAECETASLIPGPVRLGSSAVYNATTGYVLIDDAGVDHTDQLGWALDGGSAGDIIRVALL